MHQRNYLDMLNRARYSSMSHQGMPHHRRANFAMPMTTQQQRFCNHKNDSQQQPPVSAVDIAHVRAIRRINLENSLYPHGDPVAEDWIDNWDERPECPRPKWDYVRENPTWQPTLKCANGDYSGTELIQARADDVLTTSYSPLTNFHDNIRAQTHWQIAATSSSGRRDLIKDERVARVSTSDYETGGEGSDSSSVKSASSVDFDFSPRKFLAALW